MAVELPFGGTSAQKFSTELGGNDYEFFAQYNEVSALWEISMRNFGDDEWIFYGAPACVNQDLLSPYSLDIGQLIPIDTSGAYKEAGVNDFGTRVRVFWLAPGEVL